MDIMADWRTGLVPPPSISISISMSTFAAANNYKPHVRQEGFHPDDSYDPFQSHHTSFLPDAFRKFPPSLPAPRAMDLTDELASLMSNERSTHSPANSYDDAYHRPTHNIFDISAPSHHQQQQQQQQQQLPSSASSTASAFPPHFSSSAAHPHSPHDFSPHFNSTLPALNSSMRYEPHPDPSPSNPPPSSFPAHFTRHTPSPINTATTATAPPAHTSRSRSRSRPPSSGGPGAVGPTRTTRSRRNNSVSSTSPPPLHGGSRPQAIVIPGSRGAGGQVSPLMQSGPGGGSAPWFIPSHSSASEYSLPTPDSLHSHSHSHSHAQQQHHGYTSFGLSPSDPHTPHSMHLPPVSALHGHSLPKSADLLVGLNGHGHGGAHHNIIAHGNGSGANSNANGVSAVNVSNGADKQALLANEKRRRRRESHNAVERRRRDNINEKISELATLIPECMLDVGGAQSGTSPSTNPLSPIDDGSILPSPLDAWTTPPKDGPTPKKEDTNNAGSPSDSGAGSTPQTAAQAAAAAAQAQAEGAVVKANKGMILRKSVEYIRYLQQLVTAQGARNRELEAELRGYRTGGGAGSPGGSLSPGGGVPGHGQGDQGAVTPTSSPGESAGREHEEEMMLHDEVQQQQQQHHSMGGSARNGNGYGGYPGYGMLPSMPEGEGEEEDDEEEREGMEGVEAGMGMGMPGLGMMRRGSEEGDLDLGGGEDGLGEERGRGRERENGGGKRKKAEEMDVM